MTSDMPRPRPPFLQREVTRHGTVVWYVRRVHGARIRIRAPFGTPEHDAEYQAALAGEPITARVVKFNTRTLGWLIERYRETAGAKGTWGDLSPATRAQRAPFLNEACGKAGHEPLSSITRRSIEKGMAARSPNTAKHFLYALRGLFQWGLKAQHCAHDPTAGLKPIRQQSDGHPVWPEEWCRQFEAHWPVGTWERLAYDLLYWTGLRISDAVRVGRPHVKNGLLTIRDEKTRKLVPIPIDPALQRSLEAGPVGRLTFMVGARGQPMNKFAFSARFRRAARAAAVPGSAHGLRKTRATLLVEAGATDAELAAIMGWRGTQMAAFYTRSRDEALLARSAADKLAAANAQRTSMPAPSNKVRASERKRS
jgi:integrase